MKTQFMTGCNYWASHAGTEMWVNWREDIVRADLKLLADNGVTHLRVFPNWRDFQPVTPLFAGGGEFYEYRTNKDELPTRQDFLDETMLERFRQFCVIAHENNIQLIVGLLTGWMSGRLFIPPALYYKNLYTDHEALLFEQLFVRGFVKEMKTQEAINSWDFGNECNCMSKAVTYQEAYNWTMMIEASIRSEDSTRPVISGMHSLTTSDVWRIQDQGATCDILTTHPYPYWVPHCSKDSILSIRTLLHATAESEYYSGIGGKPCLVEELGTMGPMVCDDNSAALFMRLNLLSNWVHGSPGVLWWCAHEQSHLSTAPYSWNMCERELGMVDRQGNPKPMLQEMRRFRQFLKDLDTSMPPPQKDGVCILTRGQDQWGAAYMTYILAKQAGVTLDFAWCEQTLPESDVYLLPSIKGHLIMEKRYYDELKKRIREGATLYISIDDAFLTEFEELTGLRVIKRLQCDETVQLDEYEIKRQNKIHLENHTAQILKEDGKNLLFSVHSYGKGKVYFLNAPLETALTAENESFETTHYRIYEEVFSKCLKDMPIRVNNPFIGVTRHFDESSAYIVLINYSDRSQKTGLILDNGVVLYGNADELSPCSGCIIKLGKIVR